MASIDSQRRILEEASKPTMESLGKLFAELDDINKSKDKILEEILHPTEDIDLEFRKILLLTFNQMFDKSSVIYKNMQDTLDRHKESIKDQLSALSDKMTQQALMRGK